MLLSRRFAYNRLTVLQLKPVRKLQHYLIRFVRIVNPLFHYSDEQKIPPRVTLLQNYFFPLQFLMHYRYKFSCGPWVMTTIYFPPMYSQRRRW